MAKEVRREPQKTDAPPKIPAPAAHRERGFLTRTAVVVALLIALMTLLDPILYLVGLGYQEGYLGAFGVDTNFFPQTVQQYLILGFYAIIEGIASLSKTGGRFLALWAALTFILCLMGFLTHDATLDRFTRKKPKSAEPRKERWFVAPLETSLFYGAVVVYLPILSLICFIIFLGFYFIGYSAGQTLARQQIQSHKSCTYGDSYAKTNCVFILDGHAPGPEHVFAKGLLVTASGQQLALYEDGYSRYIAAGDRDVVMFPDAPQTKTRTGGHATPPPVPSSVAATPKSSAASPQRR